MSSSFQQSEETLKLSLHIWLLAVIAFLLLIVMFMGYEYLAIAVLSWHTQAWPWTVIIGLLVFGTTAALLRLFKMPNAWLAALLSAIGMLAWLHSLAGFILLNTLQLSWEVPWLTFGIIVVLAYAGLFVALLFNSLVLTHWHTRPTYRLLTAIGVTGLVIASQFLFTLPHPYCGCMPPS